jgi:chromosomal replication initiation ATPase DnaA
MSIIQTEIQRNNSIKLVMESTSQQLRDILGKPVTLIYKIKVNDISPEHIIQTVCKICNTTWSAITSESRQQKVIVPRQLTAWLLARYCGYTREKIAKEFGKADHSVVTHMIHRVNEMLDTKDELYLQPLQAIENCILKLTEEKA